MIRRVVMTMTARLAGSRNKQRHFDVPAGHARAFKVRSKPAVLLDGSADTGDAPLGEHDLLWGIHAATAWAALSALSLASPGYHPSKRDRSVPSSVRVRVCRSKCAPRFVHCIC